MTIVPISVLLFVGVVGSDTGGGDNGTADAFRDEPVSLPLMTATRQADAESSCGATR
jgi:hypothetical protein